MFAPQEGEKNNSSNSIDTQKNPDFRQMLQSTNTTLNAAF